jgi:DNA-binding IclR family transcriptional regulator
MNNPDQEKPLPRAALHPLVMDFPAGNHPERGDRKFMTSLARGIEVLAAFQRRLGPLGNKDLALLTGLPKATVSRITFTLKELGYLRVDADTGRFQLGPAILSLGYPLLSGLRIRHVAHEYMAELSRAGGGTVGLAAADGASMVYVDEACEDPSLSLRVDVGARVEMCRSALGRAWLAGIRDPDREALCSDFRESYGVEWPDLQRRIEDAVNQVRERGFCLVDKEWRRDTRTVAVPLVSPDRRTVMALGFGAPAFSVGLETLVQDIGPRLVHIGHQISRFF